MPSAEKVKEDGLRDFFENPYTWLVGGLLLLLNGLAIGLGTYDNMLLSPPIDSFRELFLNAMLLFDTAFGAIGSAAGGIIILTNRGNKA